ncbi:formyltetrahydrofolate deformylase [Profundibacterium mesophilum]|uniref:Formyltetrahydrofolate deformylase n=1 Tax=Profundibacterium mesophilum KAUST100406-0324 TaxID=1037889 RepID=A0A921TD07_9RHOB|nr:formyltetrahydrofolate deformylase [Profundibacterium mesophilum]KAF0676288.1 Formyltetrahydrofolate deformylase [Profundibacterium mesophilum KAUST100406-0324]
MTRPNLLTLSCVNRPGIVAAVTSLLARHGGNIVEAAQFDDPETGRFFMRLAFDAMAPKEFEAFREAFAPCAEQFGMDHMLRRGDTRRKVLLLVSKFDHCLVDLLYRHRIGELPMELVGIAGNHPLEALDLGPLGDVPYTHLPITRDTKPAQEARIKELVDATGAELVVLARYMQILSDDLARFLSGRCINIHHSFLPGFKGARPYHQAHARGVKLIGATAHFVTSDLDEGPIIEQDVERITHVDSPDDLVRKGRDIERRVLARAVSSFLEDRVLINGSKTVVFGR